MHTLKARSGLEIIPRNECLRLLAGRRVGRLGVVVDDQPLVLPVSYAVQLDVVVFRTGTGSKLDGAVRSKVAFEVDDLDDDGGGGWSVLVKGIAEEITEVDDWFVESLRELAPSPPVWGADHYVRIRPLQITGRRLPARR